MIRRMKLEDIKNIVDNYYDVDCAEYSNNALVSRPRAMACLVMRNITNSPLKEIASLFGRRSHSYVIHAAESVKEKMSIDSKVFNEYQDIINNINEFKLTLRTEEAV